MSFEPKLSVELNTLMFSIYSQIRDKIIKNYKEKAAGDMCLGDIELIRNWVLNKNITTDKAQFLTTQV